MTVLLLLNVFRYNYNYSFNVLPAKEKPKYIGCNLRPWNSSTFDQELLSYKGLCLVTGVMRT